MATFQSLIKRYEEMCRQGFADEEQQLRLKKLKMEISEMNGENEGDPHEQGKSYEEALNAQSPSVFEDEVTDHEEA